ncbi:MAG: hypothetical protein WCJ39_04440 [bacterium]
MDKERLPAFERTIMEIEAGKQNKKIEEVILVSQETIDDLEAMVHARCFSDTLIAIIHCYEEDHEVIIR